MGKRKKKIEVVELTPTSFSTFGWSKISAYMRCPRLYFNRYVQKVEGEPKLALLTGSAIHEGLAVYYALEERNEINAKYNIRRAIVHFLASLEDVDIDTMIDIGVTALDTCMRYIEVEDNIIDSLGKLTPEKELHLGETGITARLDLICESDEEVFFVDHKTSSVKSDSHFGRLSRQGYLVDGQFLLHHALGKFHFGDRYQGEILNIVTHTRKAEFEIAQYFLPCPDEKEISSFLEMIVTLKQSIDNNLAEDYFPKVQHQLLCQSKYGACEFFSECHPRQLESIERVKEILASVDNTEIEEESYVDIKQTDKIPF